MGNRGPGKGENANGGGGEGGRRHSTISTPSAICQQESPPSTPSADVKEILYKDLQKQHPWQREQPCKGPGAGPCLEYSRNIKDARMSGTVSEGREGGSEGREGTQAGSVGPCGGGFGLLLPGRWEP